MMSWIRKRPWIIALLIAMGVLGIFVRQHLARRQIWHFTTHPIVVWSEPFGHRMDSLALAKGLDGQIYGPLAFVIWHNHPIIADSYQHRIIISTHPWHIIATPELLVEDLVHMGNSLYFVDNHTLAVYRIEHGKPVKIIQLHPSPGQSEAIWHMAQDGQHLLLEGVKLGQGQYETWLRQYKPNGQLVQTLNVAKTRWNNPFEVNSQYPIGVVVRSFVVAPNRQLVIEVAGDNPYERLIQLYNVHNRLIRQTQFVSPEAIVHSQLLGVNNMGWIYLGINLTEPGKALVEILTPKGRTMMMKVRSVPVGSVVYGTVEPNGSLYLLQSTAKEYCIVKWALVPSERWTWNGQVI
ncbi:hypothetical protein [Sulfobacillus thermosulfidooxidans]|uniref:hypothetical protein n=1 Tax=Sulfobacillus thermosulfidooxidans TaxID=28034 RepID=UPI0006B50A56|nr:hypothetical protein [Sulfobacillus thermosulfidooxidans]